MPYSAEEVQASVEKVVLSTIQVKYDTLGVRRNDVSFSEIQQAAAGVFLLYYNSPFYVTWLGAQKLLELVTLEQQMEQSLETAIRSTGRRVQPIKDLTPLNNAKAALFELEGASSSRNKSVKDITKVPAFQRFVMNTDAFLAASGPAIKQNGDIVPTPQEARGNLPSLVSQLKTSHTELVRRAQALSVSISDYQSMNLPALVAGGVISRARQLLDDRSSELEALNETDRLTVIRGVILDLLSSKSLVQKYGAGTDVSQFYTVVGLGEPYSDETHLATSAFVEGTLGGSYGVVLKNCELDLYLDRVVTAKCSVPITQISAPDSGVIRIYGTFTGTPVIAGDVVVVPAGLSNQGTRWVITTVTATYVEGIGLVDATPEDPTQSFEFWEKPDVALVIPASYTAKIDGQIAEPFATNHASPNNELNIDVDGTDYLCPLTSGASVSASTLCTDINAVMSGTGVVAEQYFAPLHFSGHMTITGSTPTWTFTLVGAEVLPDTVVVGDIVTMLTGINVGAYVGITAIALDRKSFTAGGSYNADATPRVGEIGPLHRRVRLAVDDPESALSTRLKITVVGDTQKHIDTAITLGMAPGNYAISRPSTAQEVVDGLGGQTARAKFDVLFDPVRAPPIQAHTDPQSVNKVIFSVLTTTANTTGGFTPAVFIADQDISDVRIGAGVIIRNGDLANVGIAGTVIDVTYSSRTITATMDSFVAAGDVTLELGYAFASPPQKGDLVRIYGGPNAGDYYVGSIGASSFELFLENTTLPQFNNLNQPVTFSAAVGVQTITITSADQTTASRVRAQGSAGWLFFSSHDAEQAGTTPWFLLPQVVKGLLTGDLLELYLTQYNVYSSRHEVTAIAGQILKVFPDVDSTQAPIDFSTEKPVPFARLRLGHVADSSLFSTELTLWLGESAQQLTKWFQDFSRYVNPLLSNTNPTDLQVKDALSKLDELMTQLGELSTALNAYHVESIPAVDTLIKSFREKGGDRAADLLIEGQFSTFFGLDMHEASYAGSFMKSVRTVALNDMPVRKIDRADLTSSRVISKADSPDFEYDRTDIDPTPQPDPSTIPD
jgi:hypothetical protein